jgi:DNA mismatch repair protein MutS
MAPAMFETYVRLYKHYVTQYGSNTAIFLLVGSFYELYDIHKDGEGQTSFDRATTILGIQKVPKGEGLFSAGFKDSSLQKFATMLTRENWTVVIVDQVKDDKGSVSSRDVARILSPGTHIENTGADSFYTAGLWIDASWDAETAFAAAAFELTTGVIETYEGTAKRGDWSSDSLLHFFQVHPPKELVVWWRGHAIDQPTETFLRRILGVPSALIHVRQAEQGALEKPVVREDLLRRCFKPKSLLPLRTVLGLTPLTERCLASLLLFVEDHFSSAIDLLRIPMAWVPEDSVYLGNHALTQLNMITSREEDSVLALFLKAYTPMGRRALRRRLLYPITQPAALEQLYSEVDWCIGMPAKEAVLGNLRQIGDLSRLHRNITVATVSAATVTALDMSYKCASRLMGQVGHPLDTFKQHETDFTEYRTAFAEVFDIDKALKPQDDIFCLTDAAGPKCAAVEASIRTARDAIKTIHLELAKWVGVEKEYFRLEEKEASIVVAANRTVIKETERAIKAGSVPESLKGIQVHAKKSSSSLEVPGLNALFNKILGLRLALAKAAKEELPAACDSLATSLWDPLEAWIAQVDMSFTIARVSVERGFVRPVLVSGPAASLKAEGLRHPLIEAQQTRVEYVKHDVELGQEGWLVYGMNASGKSSLMKAVGIATILAQCGCFVPATCFSYTPFKSLFTRILNTDNLWAGLSSFAVEMTELAEILRRADPWSLVLGDEVCSGTESLSAMALVGASLEHLSKRGARFIFATHLHGLQEIPVVAALPLKVWHLQVRFDPATQRLFYDRTLHPGSGSSLYGLEVAKAMAVPFDVLESAHAIRKGLVGMATEADAPTSGWNSAVQRRVCEVCGSHKVLEAHHIQQRSEAVAGRLADGTHMNSMKNLTVLCEVCHDKVHAGKLEVGPVQQTSEGPVRVVKTKALPKDMADETLELIKNDLRTYRTLAPARLIFYIEEKHGVKLTTQRLKTLRASL